MFLTLALCMIPIAELEGTREHCRCSLKQKPESFYRPKEYCGWESKKLNFEINLKVNPEFENHSDGQRIYSLMSNGYQILKKQDGKH